MCIASLGPDWRPVVGAGRQSRWIAPVQDHRLWQRRRNSPCPLPTGRAERMGAAEPEGALKRLKAMHPGERSTTRHGLAMATLELCGPDLMHECRTTSARQGGLLARPWRGLAADIWAMTSLCTGTRNPKQFWPLTSRHPRLKMTAHTLQSAVEHARSPPYGKIFMGNKDDCDKNHKPTTERASPRERAAILAHRGLGTKLNQGGVSSDLIICYKKLGMAIPVFCLSLQVL